MYHISIKLHNNDFLESSECKVSCFNKLMKNSTKPNINCDDFKILIKDSQAVVRKKEWENHYAIYYSSKLSV